MKRLLLILLLFANMAHIRAQDALVDSLVSVLKNTKEDTTKLRILEDLIDNAPDGVWEKFNEEMGSLSEKLLKSSNGAQLRIAKEFYAGYLGNKGYESGQKYDYTKALEYLGRCVKIQEEIGDKNELIASLSSIGAIYEKQKEYDQALKNYGYAITVQQSTGDTKYLVVLYNNIGVIFDKTNKADSALIYYLKALNTADETKGKSIELSSLYSSIGTNMLKRSELEKALFYYQKGLKSGEERGDGRGKSRNLEGMGRVYFERGDLNRALGFALQALSIATEENAPTSIIKAAELLKKIYQKQGNYRNAFEMHNLEITTSDSLLSKENQKAVIQYQFKYEYGIKEATAKAEQEKKDGIAIAELKRQKIQKLTLLGGFSIMVLFAAVFFRQRNKIGREKKRSDDLLLNILPEEIAEELKAKGSAEAQLIDQVTVLFTDFKGFTQLSEKLSPKELVAEINECFSAFDHIMHKYGVEKIKTIGDAYMAAGGLPTANNTHAIDVVNAAMAVQQFMHDHKVLKEAAGKLFFEIRIGVHTGPVVAGIVGVKKFAYDIWGDTVNTASRMESSGEAGKVNISGTTYEFVKDKFKCTHRGKIQAKHKGELDMYYVEGRI